MKKTASTPARRAWLATPLALALLALGACAPGPSLYIHHLKLGKTAEREQGEQLKLQRQDADQYGTAQPGYFVLKSLEDWEQFWQGTTTSIPKPPKIDFGSRMILVASTESAQAQALSFEQAIESGTAMHVYIDMVRPGPNCPLRTGGVIKQDLVIVDRTEKPIHFYVEGKTAASCGEAPLAALTCSVAGKGPSAPEITANPGDEVTCTANVEVRGVFAAIDQHWNWLDHPAGSIAKLAFAKNNTEVKFVVDVFGKYSLKFDVVDDAGRRGEAVATVRSAPQKTGLFVQMGWTGFDQNDDPATFPRIDWEFTESGSGEGACTLNGGGAKPSWCLIDKRGPLINTLQLPTTPSEATYTMKVSYTDDRFQGGPAVCAKVFLNGEQTQEICDRETRQAGSTWLLGNLLARNGLIEAVRQEVVVPKVEEPVKPAASKPAAKKPAAAKPAAKKPAAKKGTGVFNP